MIRLAFLPLLAIAGGIVILSGAAADDRPLTADQASVSERILAQSSRRARVRALRRTPPHSMTRIGDVPMTIRGRARRARARALTKYDFPYWGDELAPGERIFRSKKIHSSSGSQKWGYDLGAMRWNSSSDTWSEVKSSTNWNNPKNSDYFVYGQKVYAMGPGKVIRCWRNAPQNPRPFSSALGDDFNQDFKDKKWLHKDWRNKLMPGGGNHLVVEEADGDLILYAHAQTGSISSNLCPHGKSLFSKADNTSETDVPAAQQAVIRAGQYLFRTGNSGNSSAPHLHIHLQTGDGNPIVLPFRRGLSTAVNGNKADINAWTRFAGNRIPDGPVLVWPARRLGKEYARHGFPAGDFQRMFDHLADSGYWPEWIDGYSVGGRPYLNFIWRPAKNSWRAFFLVTGRKYQSEFNKARAAGYQPHQVESSLAGGRVRYTVIFRKGMSGKYLARHGMTVQQHDAVFNQAKQQKLNPVSDSVVSAGGKLYFTTLYRSNNIGSWVLKPIVKKGDYQGLYNQNARAGRRPRYVQAYKHRGQVYYSVIFSSATSRNRKDRHGMSASKYQSEYNSALNAGQLTRSVSGVDNAASNHEYIAVWSK